MALMFESMNVPEGPYLNFNISVVGGAQGAFLYTVASLGDILTLPSPGSSGGTLSKSSFPFQKLGLAPRGLPEVVSAWPV